MGVTGCKQTSDDPANDGALTRAEVSAIYKQAANSIWEMLGKENPTNAVQSYKITIPEHTEEQEGEGSKQSFIHNLSVMTLYVNFIGDLYANENFVYTDKVVSFTATANIWGETQTHSLSITAEIDKENNMIYSEFVLGDDSMGYLYMLMDIGYDFATSTATSFRMIYYNVYPQGDEMVRFLNDQKYTADGKCYLCSELTEDYAPILLQFEQDFATRKANGVTLTANFDAEYQTMNDLAALLTSGGGY
jgi:hypothetical protein